MTIEAIRQRYLQALLTHPSVATITLSSGAAPVSLKQVYVSRTVLHEVRQEQTREAERDARPSSKKPNAADESSSAREVLVKLPVNLWETLREQRVVLIEGPAGMGKSTLSKHLVRESLTQNWRLPIWIPFHQFAMSPLSLDDYLDQITVPELGLAGAERILADGTGQPRLSLGQWLAGQWRGGLGLLLVDGLDEVFDPQIRSAALDRLHLEGTGRDRPVTILTTRPFLAQQLPFPVAKTELQPLTPTEQDQLLARYRQTVEMTDTEFQTFREKVRTQLTGSDLMSRPGHLVQIMRFYAAHQAVPATETDLLMYLVRHRLQTTGRVQPPVDPDDPETKQRLLAAIALHLLACRQGQSHTRAQLLALIQQVLREHANHHRPLFALSQASMLLNDLVHNSGLLTRVESDGYVPLDAERYDFTPERYSLESAIWTQLLTGTALADQQISTSLNLTETQVLEFLDKKAWDPEWEPVLKSWVAQAENPFSLFDRLTDKQQDDLARHRLGTAGRCLFEVKPPLRHHPEYQALSVQIPTEAYEMWWELATQDDVEDADQLVETSLRKSWAETAVGQAKLLNELKDRDAWRKDPEGAGWTRIIAEKALRRLGPAMPERVQQALVAALRDEYGPVRAAAAQALGGLGPAMPEAVQQALVAALRDEYRLVRYVASEALREFGVAMPEAIQQALVAALREEHARVRDAAARALGGLGPAMPEGVQQALVTALREEHGGARVTAARALGGLGPAMPEGVQQALVVVLRGDREDLGGFRQCAAAEALGKLGPAMSEGVQEALVVALKEEHEAVWSAAATALGGLGVEMPEAVQQALVRALECLKGSGQSAAGAALSSVQQQGLRIFRDGAVVGSGRLVSDLSTTVPIADSCSQNSSRPRLFITAS